VHGVVLIQYTHLAWSRRGFSIGVLRAHRALGRMGATVGTVFHDPTPFAGQRFRDRVRSGVQRAVVRRLARKSAITFSTVEPDLVAVFDGIEPRPRFLPAGSNVPVAPRHRQAEDRFVVSVFGVTERDRDEALMIADIMQRAARGLRSVSLQVFGRGAMEAEDTLRSSIGPIPLNLAGVIDASEVTNRIARSDALLFVRGEASSRRGTLVAAVCNGVPVVAPVGPETGPAVRAAGIGFFPEGDKQAAADELIRLGSDPDFAERQGARQVAACETTFSWPAIANRLLEAL
jgi:glycosyltransferase involved in cell wall biosynthesis